MKVMTRICIEVGSHDGLDTRAIHSRFNLPIFGFEPHPRFFAIATESTKHLQPPVKIFQMAVSGEDKEAITLNESRAQGAHSILQFRPDSELETIWIGRTDVQFSGRTFTVPCTRLDTFLELQGFFDPAALTIEYLHIDAQGVDLEVLMSLGKFLPCVQAGILETAAHAGTSIYVGQQNTVASCSEALKAAGFQKITAQPNDGSGVGGSPCEYNIKFSRH